MRIWFSAGDSSQFDEVLTRDATNSCWFLYPLREGCTLDTYITSTILWHVTDFYGVWHSLDFTVSIIIYLILNKINKMDAFLRREREMMVGTNTTMGYRSQHCSTARMRINTLRTSIFEFYRQILPFTEIRKPNERERWFCEICAIYADFLRISK